MDRHPFRIDFDSHGLRGRFGRFASHLAEHAMGFPTLNRIHQRALNLPADDSFFERALEALDVGVRIVQKDLERIPKTGPIIIVANHPFGALDGIILTALVQRVRPDIKVMANHLLKIIPQVTQNMLFVDPFGGPDAKRFNLSSLRSAFRHVKAGGALAIFPAGEVSSFNRSGEVADIGWSPSIARLIRSSNAPVLPVFFSGHNSALFHVAGLIHPRLRTLLLPRELLRQRGQSITVHIGHTIAPAKLTEVESDDQLASYLRARTYLLGGRSEKQLPAEPQIPAHTKAQEPIAPPEPSAQIACEIAAIPTQNILAATGSLQVLYASASQLDATLREIGRLREITFRRVGEGTGKSRDLDQFDRHYLHLLVWNKEKSEIVGAYRMGFTDQILATHGATGLYTSTLFNFKDELLNQISPAIELGRSFVRPEYQKEYAPLMLLWKGIAHFCAQNPRYRRLFGTVSISNEYHSLSRQILMAFLRRNAFSPVASGVVAKNPPKFLRGRDHTSKLAALAVKSVEAVDELLGEIESDRGGMPVLLRQYLRLNAKLLGFNIDPDFGDVLDGLMLVDLLQVERAILTRYMGRENLASFYAFHGKEASK